MGALGRGRLLEVTAQVTLCVSHTGGTSVQETAVLERLGLGGVSRCLMIRECICQEGPCRQKAQCEGDTEA